MAPLAGQPASAAKALAAQPLFPLQVSGDRQYFLSFSEQHAAFPDRRRFMQLLQGTIGEGGSALEG